MSRTLLIVESPAKARTLSKYLGKDYIVKASVGHVRDLPRSELGVDVEKGFTAKYVTIKGKEKIIRELKSAAEKVDCILLGPDPDREGEAIAWHVARALAIKDKPVKRVLFNEITKKAVLLALANPRELDENKFASQQARRILDRLVGYNLSPFLWKKVKFGLSAGRVQSVALRIVTDREEEVRKFVPEEYWNIHASLSAATPPPFVARLTRIGDDKAKVKDGETARKIEKEILNDDFLVHQVLQKESSRKAAPPFITSTLQQAASSRLRMAPRSTMRVAQQLYEGMDIGADAPVGLITYMRTDSVRVSAEAAAAAAETIRREFGPEYLPKNPNVYKSRKGSQDAHEAIRPTQMDLTPEKLAPRLSPDQLKLYRLIWQRFMASQMAPARFLQKTIEAKVGPYIFLASSTEEVFAGHLRAYRADNGPVSKDEKGGEEKEVRNPLPKIAVGDSLQCGKLILEQKFTQPPSRFSEAALIREMEEDGIGRPSTYAAIMGTILEKEYVEKIKGLLHPTPLGEVVTQLLVDAFPAIMEIGFTASLEERLDNIEEGSLVAENLLSDFYKPFAQSLENANVHLKDFKLKGQLTDIPCDKCGSPMGIKFGRKGSFLACSHYPECKSTKNFRKNEEGRIVVLEDEVTDIACEKCGKAMIRREGRWGPYLACSGYPDCRNIVSLKKPAPKPRYHVAEGAEPKCEKCEKTMKLRVSRYGSHFWSCSSYPKCRGTLAYDTGLACLRDGCSGSLVERLPRKRNVKKKPFWACSECDFILGDRPLPDPCPRCGHPYTVEHLPQDAPDDAAPLVRCPKEGCAYEKAEVTEDKASA